MNYKEDKLSILTNVDVISGFLNIQKDIIKTAREMGKIVIVATEMLETMMENNRPKRAETADIANAVFDGTDAVMLSGETAAGKYPIEALNMMVHIVENTENHLDYDTILKKSKEHQNKSVSCAIGYASVATERSLGAKCIVTPTFSGSTARVVSKFKPKADIIGVSPVEEALRRMQIYWGVTNFPNGVADTMDELIDQCIVEARERKLIKTKNAVRNGRRSLRKML